MTEADWLARNNLSGMLDHVIAISRNSERCRRKLRLLACAGCRRIWHLLGETSQRAVEVSEQFADGWATWEDLRCAGEAAERVALELERCSRFGWNAARTAAAVAGDARAAAERAVGMAGDMDMLRDVFSNPFRPVVLEKSWLGWNNGCVAEMAQAIYEDRQFCDLPILADALMDAGCDNPDILDHCSRPAAHVRGCWVLDLLLEKG
jgi:hypothetical protein